MADTRYFRCDQRTRCPLGRERKTIECDASRSYTVDGQKFVCPLSEPACERQLKEIHPTASAGPRWMIVAVVALVIAAAGAFLFLRHPGPGNKPLVTPVLKPVLKVDNLGGAEVGKFFELPVRNVGGAAKIHADALPAGLVYDAASAKIAGIPKEAGKSQIRIVAENAGGNDFAIVTLVVGPHPIPLPPAPHFTSSSAATATAAQAFSYRITAQPMPDNVQVAGLPNWLEFDSKQLLLSGTPPAGGMVNLAITGQNGGGSDNLHLAIRVAELPKPAAENPAKALVEPPIESPVKRPVEPPAAAADQAYPQTAICFELLETIGRDVYNRALADLSIESATRRTDGMAVDDYQRMKAAIQNNIRQAEASYLQSIHVLASFPAAAVEAALVRCSAENAKFSQPSKERYLAVMRAHLNLLQNARQLGSRWEDDILQIAIDDSPSDSPLRNSPRLPQP